MDRPAILTRLAQGTHDLHARIERRVPLLYPGLHIDTYRGYLESMLGFYEPFEDTLAAFPWHGAGLDFDRRRKRGLLITDLRALGHDDRSLAAIPRCRELPCPADLMEALGCLYVTEGATLGGRILTRHVGQAIGLSPASGSAFLASYGNAVGCMWRSFGMRLARIVQENRGNPDESTDAHRHARILNAARSTFITLERWLVCTSSSRAMPRS